VTTSDVVNITVLPGTSLPITRSADVSNLDEAVKIADVNDENTNNGINNVLRLKLAPNPVNNILNIYTTGLQKNKTAILSVISSTGVVMQTKQLSNSTQNIQLNVSSLVCGVYILKVVIGDQILYTRFVKL